MEGVAPSVHGACALTFSIGSQEPVKFSVGVIIFACLSRTVRPPSHSIFSIMRPCHLCEPVPT